MSQFAWLDERRLHVIVYDNSDPSQPYRFVAGYEFGKRLRVLASKPL